MSVFLCCTFISCDNAGKRSSRTTNEELDNRRPTDEGETLPEFDVVAVLADGEAGIVTLGDTSVSINSGTVEGFDMMVTLRRTPVEDLPTQDQVVFDASQEIIRVVVFNNSTGEIIARDLLKKPLMVEQVRTDIVDASQLKLAYIAEPESESPRRLYVDTTDLDITSTLRLTTGRTAVQASILETDAIFQVVDGTPAGFEKWENPDAAGGDGSSSTSGTATSGEGSGSPSVTTLVSPPLDAVSNSGALNLSWSSVGDAAGYLLVRRTGSAVNWSPDDGASYGLGALDGVHTVEYVGTDIAVTDVSLANGTTYHYALFVYDSFTRYAAPTLASATPLAEISNWLHITGSPDGLNYAAMQNSFAPSVASLNSTLYAAWIENTGTSIGQVRVSYYNNNESSPGWTFVDGGGATGINVSTGAVAKEVNLITFNGKLYAFWSEQGQSNWQIRAAVFNGNNASPSWLLVDGGGGNSIINYFTSQPAKQPHAAVVNSKLYITFAEFTTVWQNHVSVYNGNDASPTWTPVDGGGANGINQNNSTTAEYPRLTAFNSKLYATWYEAGQTRVKVYNGNDSSPLWTFVDGGGAAGINLNGSHSAIDTRLVVNGTKMYAGWTEDDGLGEQQVRVAVYNGNDGAPVWTSVAGDSASGLNYATSALTLDLVAYNSRLYAAWSESAGTGVVRLALYNGDDLAPSWSYVDGNGNAGINLDAGQSAFDPRLIVHDSKLYTAWRESNAGFQQVRIAVGQ